MEETINYKRLYELSIIEKENILLEKEKIILENQNNLKIINELTDKLNKYRNHKSKKNYY